MRHNPLQTRNNAVLDLTTRAMPVRAATANEQERSIEATIATESPVEVYDWRSGKTIDEVLRADGAHLPAQIPLLATHDRYSLDSILGSARDLQVGDGRITGRLFFAKDDQDADKAWNKTRQGHLTDVSVGYRAEEFVEIQPEQTATVSGQPYTAGKRAMRIVTRWTLKEVSLVPIGADQAAKMRQDANTNNPPLKGNMMNKDLREYLESLDLRADATDADALAYHDKLAGEQRTRADALKDGKRQDPPAENSQRSDPQPPAENGQRADPPAAGGITQAELDNAIRKSRDDDRTRRREITKLAGDDVPEAIRERAIDEDWDDTRISREFLGAVREGRSSGVGTAIHSRSHDADCNVRSLAAGMLIGQGVDPTKHSLHNGQSDARSADALTEQDADRGHEFRALSAVDLVRECAAIDTGRYHRDPAEAFRAAVSGATFGHVFSTNVYARLIAGWETIGDTTLGWCDEEDVPNFMQQEDISLQANARLEKLARGDTAKHATASDSHETYKIARYAKQFVVDEQDILDDRLNAIMRMPFEMGEAARKFRPDLVYSLMMENPALVADTSAVFNATAVTTTGGHANLGSAVLGSDAMKAAISAMGKQRLNGNVLNIRPNFLIVPAELEWTARALTASAALAKLFADSSDPFYSQMNLLAQEGIRVVIDDRLGAVGVVDPITGVVRTGSDTAWYMAMGGSKSIRVAYLRGTNRQPVMRSFMLDKGQWGIGWDIKLDIGAAFMEYRGWYKSTGV